VSSVVIQSEISGKQVVAELYLYLSLFHNEKMCIALFVTKKRILSCFCLPEFVDYLKQWK